MRTPDTEKLNALVGRLVGDLGASITGSLIVLGEPVGLGLGAQAGEQRLRQIAADAGFSRFRRAAETPFNLVFEAQA